MTKTLRICSIGDGASLPDVDPLDDLAELKNYDVVFVRDFGCALAREIRRTNSLRWVHTGSAGVDHVLGNPDTWPPSIRLSNSAGVFDADIAEWVLASLLIAAKDLGETFRLQTERRWLHRDTRSLRGTHAVVVGIGGVGTAIAATLAAVGVIVDGVASRPRTPAGTPFRSIHGSADFRRAISSADHVIAALPLTDSSRDLFDSSVFSVMGPGAVFVNVGRGESVEEQAMVEALDAGLLRFAALDVFRNEPLAPESPLWQRSDVLVSPHMSGDSLGWRDRIDQLFLDNLRRFELGLPLRNDVTPDNAPGSAQRSNR